MRVSILIPCYNEEKTIAQCLTAALDQSERADEIIVVDDGSTDQSLAIVKGFGDQIKVVRLPRNSGNKSYAQEYGLRSITGDIVITTDADSLLHHDFARNVRRDFADPSVAAVAGYVKSLRYSWITSCREIDYVITQDIHKVAQSYINYLFVIPGCAGAFRTELFKDHILFDHDTITEDLDFTYKLHERGFAITYDREAIVYTQDPPTLKAYIRQMRRWYGGGWQNLMKHRGIARKPAAAFELSLYLEGLIFSLVFLVLPFLNFTFARFVLLSYLLLFTLLSLYAAFRRRRLDLLANAPFYALLSFINAWIFFEQFVHEVLLQRKNRLWHKVDRYHVTPSV
ncbi:MAG: glycosyltransferase [Parcubacteria group bacterium]|nr:glycosyltransferase [Parcubacteria group bacterium]